MSTTLKIDNINQLLDENRAMVGGDKQSHMYVYSSVNQIPAGDYTQSDQY